MPSQARFASGADFTARAWRAFDVRWRRLFASKHFISMSLITILLPSPMPLSPQHSPLAFMMASKPILRARAAPVMFDWSVMRRLAMPPQTARRHQRLCAHAIDVTRGRIVDAPFYLRRAVSDLFPAPAANAVPGRSPHRHRRRAFDFRAAGRARRQCQMMWRHRYHATRQHLLPLLDTAAM